MNCCCLHRCMAGICLPVALSVTRALRCSPAPRPHTVLSLPTDSHGVLGSVIPVLFVQLSAIGLHAAGDRV